MRWLIARSWILTEGELALGRVAGISLAEDSVAITRNNTARIQRGPEVVGDGLVAKVTTDSLLHLGEPVENLLVSQTVERTGKTVETGSEREEGRAESTADKVRGVGRDVATLMIGVDGKVETHELNKAGVVAEAELVGEVERVVLVLLDGSNLAALEDILINAGSDVGELGDEVHGVLKGVTPVLLLVNTLGVGLSEGRGVLESSNSQ